MKTKKITVYRLLFSDNSTGAWTTDIERLKEDLKIFKSTLIQKGEMEVVDND